MPSTSPGTEPGRLAVIGGGPAGLMAAECAAACGITVDVYDAMPSVGRKLLRAGIGGLNLTHAEPADAFLGRYGDRSPWVAPWLAEFGPAALRDWAKNLGIDTFVGSSGRVFPVGLKAAPLLRAWLQRLRGSGVRFHSRHLWQGWDSDGALRFATPSGVRSVAADAVLLALGGGSWPRLGSNGAWVALLAERGVPIAPLRPANCGFDVAWSEAFRSRYAGQPLKPLAIHCPELGLRQRGECIVTAHGLEGGLIYALSAPLREQIARDGFARIELDLAPDREPQALAAALAQASGKQSLSNRLRRAGLTGAKAGLLRECLSPAELADPQHLAAAGKALPLNLLAPRPLEEAISSAGGVAREALDDGLMLRKLPGVFCAGEMLDWEAPTGGYLLTACFASGRIAGKAAAAWLHHNRLPADTTPSYLSRDSLATHG